MNLARTAWLAAIMLFVLGCNKKHCAPGDTTILAPDGGVFCIGGPGEPDGGGFCGDGVCEGDESCVSCAADCSCLDAPAEASPPKDAPGSDRGGFCGDGVCDGNESCTNCPADCTCLVDAARDAPPGFCGDGICNGNETCTTCPFDCFTQCILDAPVVDARVDARLVDAGSDALLTSCPSVYDTIAAPTTVSGTTVGGPMGSLASCGFSTGIGPAHWYLFLATATGSCHASTANAGTFTTNFDTVLSVRAYRDCASDVACNDDNGIGQLPANSSYVTWTADTFPFGIYWIVVQGYGGASGNFALTVSCP
jgi:hypothetical protein